MSRAATFRLSQESHLRLKILREVLDLSTATAALQYAIGKTYDRLPDLAPHAFPTAEDARDYLKRRLDDDLLAAYRATAYEVFDGADVFALAVGAVSPRLDAVLDRHGASGCAYITACNPLSRPLAPPFNALRLASLDRALEALGHPVYRGRGVGADWRWAPEESRLVVGLDAEGARRLGREFGQAAWLIARRGEAVELVWA